MPHPLSPPPPAPLVCDLCHSPFPTWEYHLRKDSTLVAHYDDGAPPFVDSGEWLACEECKAIVETVRASMVDGVAVLRMGKLIDRALLNPAMVAAIDSGLLTSRDARGRVMRFLGAFVLLLDGPPIPYTDHPTPSDRLV